MVCKRQPCRVQPCFFHHQFPATHMYHTAHFQVSPLCRTSRGNTGRRVGVHTRGWVAEATQKPTWPRAAARTGQGRTTPPQRLTAAVPGCRGALDKQLCSQALGSVLLPAETFRLGCAPVFGTHNPGLLPVMSAGPFIIGWEELWPKKMERRRNIPGGRVVFWLDEEGLALNLLLKLETGSFHYE